MNLMLPEMRDDYNFQEWWRQWASFFFQAIGHFNFELQHLGCMNVRIIPSRESVPSRLGLDKHPEGLGLFSLSDLAEVCLQASCDSAML